MLVWNAIPSITPMMSAILRELSVMSLIVVTTSDTACPPRTAASLAETDNWFACCAVCALLSTVAVICAIDAAVSCTLDAACSVRALAQRSANAAKEIKTLIENSVGRIASGAQLVDGAGRTMEDIVAQVKRVSDLIAEISASTAEQSSGVTQVDQAVVHLDSITQQNAALVEQSAAASESLQQQATRLVDAVNAFR